MKRNKGDTIRAVVSFLVISMAVFVALDRTLPPRALPSSAPATQFSAERAIEHIAAIAQEPRLVGQPAFEAARDYVAARLTDMGMSPEIQLAPGVENVLGRMPGASSRDAILLVAHLDSTANSPGASDDASGVAVLLETARALRTGSPLRNTLMLLFTAPEETGYHGAQAFIREHPWAREVKLVINFDTGGLSGPSELTNTSPKNGWLIRELARADPYAFGSSASGVGDSDFVPFKQAGYPGYAFDYARDRRKHTPFDSIGNINPPSIQHHGYHALHLARHFGNLGSLEDPKEPNPVFFDVLRLGLVRYPMAWVIPIMIVVVLLFAGVVTLGFRRKCLTIAGAGLGVLVFAVSLITAPLAVRLLWGVLSGAVPTYQVRYYGHAVHEPLLLALFAGTALAVTSAWYALLQKVRKVHLPDLVIGALVVLLLAAIFFSIDSPEGSYGLTGSLFFGLLAAGYWFFSMGDDKDSPTPAQLAALLAAAIVAVSLLVPSIYMTFTGSDTDDLLMSFVGLEAALGFLAAPLGVVMKPRRWLLPASALLSALVLLVVALVV